MRGVNHKQGGAYFAMIGSFLILGGIVQARIASADTPIEQMSVFGPVLLSAGLVLIVIGFILAVFLFMTDY
jgi:hypothetical protein